MHQTVKRLLFGSADLTQQVTIGLRDPQQEITVELHGLGDPIDVTNRHTLACAAPCTVAIQLDARPSKIAELQFRDRTSSRRLLGRLDLSFTETIATNVACFGVTSAANYCLPAPQLWARYAHWAYLRRRNPPDVPMAVVDIHAMPVVFICPRPVVVVSACEGEIVNVFPMNLMGPLGAGQFGFALNSARAASALVKRARRLAISTVPVDKAPLVRQLARNHKRPEGVQLNELPFETKPSTNFGLPTPSFALRVREMEVIDVREPGSHTFFVARIIRDEQRDEPRDEGRQFFMVHGIYQARRQQIAKMSNV